MIDISMKKILVALDGSDHSKKAASLAIDFAKKYDAELYIIHVLEDKKIPKGFEDHAKAAGIPPDYFDLVCRSDKFVGEAEASAKEEGIKKVVPLCHQGDPADEIILQAKTNNVDLIIMGNRGLGKFSKAIMGSVSSKVCNHAKSTCITVK